MNHDFGNPLRLHALQTTSPQCKLLVISFRRICVGCLTLKLQLHVACGLLCSNTTLKLASYTRLGGNHGHSTRRMVKLLKVSSILHKKSIFPGKVSKIFDFLVNFRKKIDLPGINCPFTATSLQIILFLFKYHHFQTYFRYMIS